MSGEKFNDKLLRVQELLLNITLLPMMVGRDAAVASSTT